MKYFRFLWLVLFIDANTGCPLDCSKVSCLQGFDPFSCPDNTIFLKDAALCGCCPGCIRYRGPGEPCVGDSSVTFDIRNYFTAQSYFKTGSSTPVVQSEDCAPGLKCQRTKICSKYNTNCLTPNPHNKQWMPECDVDGSYKAVQCKTNGVQPRCFCYNKIGERIFGFDWIQSDPVTSRQEMHCLCSRLVDDLKKKQQENQDLFTFHCTQNGNFQRLQCNAGSCYCVDPRSGQPLSSVVPEKLWQTLTCYNKTTMGDRYLKNCDSQSHALAQIRRETQRHGSSPLSLQAPLCDADGSYSSKQCKDTQCYCNNKANVQIGAYATERYTPQEDNQKCQCARDKVWFASIQRPHVYTCDGAGNYRTFQTVGDLAFCVDSDGFFTSEQVPVADRTTLECFEQ